MKLLLINNVLKIGLLSLGSIFYMNASEQQAVSEEQLACLHALEQELVKVKAESGSKSRALLREKDKLQEMERGIEGLRKESARWDKLKYHIRKENEEASEYQKRLAGKLMEQYRADKKDEPSLDRVADNKVIIEALLINMGMAVLDNCVIL